MRLTRYPLAAALSDNLPTVAFAVLLLAAGALTFWRRPGSPSARAFLATTALVPMAITAAPCGLGAIDLAGGRGIWPHAGGELWCALGMGTALVTAVTLTGVPDRVRRRPWLLAVAYLVPLAGYGVWVAAMAGGDQPDAARLQVLLTVAGPALLATTPAVLAVTGVLYVRAIDREDRLATRLVLLGVGGGVVARLLLGDVPQRITGRAPGALAAPHPPDRGRRCSAAWPWRSCATGSTRSSRPSGAPWSRPSSLALVGAAFLGLVVARWTSPPTSPSGRCSPVASSRCSSCRSPSPCSGPCAGRCTATGTSRTGSCRTSGAWTR